MTSVRELCRQRRISKIDLMTPLLIPSFSSKGFPDIGMLISTFREHITDVTMLSCYDIFYGHLDYKLLTPNLLFIDSGGYEARQEYSFYEAYQMEHEARTWSREQHFQVLENLDTFSALVLVSFDEIANGVPLTDQIDQSRAFFKRFPEAVSDFLIKPYASDVINVDGLLEGIGEFSGFDLIGFTEKELGNSLTERLSNLAKLRKATMERGLDIPIHVFGCLDPLSVQLYYLCGADVFDGLSWLRFAFHNSVALYRNNWTVFSDQGNLSDTETKLLSCAENLRIINHLKQSMERYATSLDVNALELDVRVVERTLGKAGITL